jgi:hypothetical protein
VHPVFHVSQLKKAVGSKVAVSSLPQELSELQVLEKVLQHRLINRGVRSVLQGLIQWSSAPASLAMWEDLEALRQHFPAAPAWGQAGAYGGGDVSAACSQGAQVGKEVDQGVGRHVGSRRRRPSVRVSGSEWIGG